MTVADSSVPFDRSVGEATPTVEYAPSTDHTAETATPPRQSAVVRLRHRLDGHHADAALLLGALSVVTFWAFGLGLVLGLGALVLGAVALRIPDADRMDAGIGIAAGVVGVVAGLVFLGATLPYF